MSFQFQVPSAFLLTDALLHLDLILKQKLLMPLPTESKIDVAAREAKRLKNLIQTLRGLYRNCPSIAIRLGGQLDPRY